MLAYPLIVAMLLQGAAEAPISLTPFDDGFSHWEKKFGRDHDLPRYTPEQFREIADNLLMWQNPDGGWPKDIDWRAKISQEKMNRIMGVTKRRRSTFDNHNTFPQIAYLAEAYQRTAHDAYRTGALAGLEHVFEEQRPSGGWRGADVDAITFNDGTMIGIMKLLQAIEQDAPHFAWLDGPTRDRASSALQKAIDGTLKCQIVSQGVKTAWAQQHDHETFLPVKARTYELPGITALESVGIVRFLMGLKSPSPDVVVAIEDAIAWLRQSAIHGIRLDEIEIAPVRYENHTATRDRIIVQDPEAPALWARYYDVETGKPFFCNRDGVVVNTLAEVHLERRTGYAWYGTWPQRLLDRDYPRWRARR